MHRLNYIGMPAGTNELINHPGSSTPLIQSLNLNKMRHLIPKHHKCIVEVPDPIDSYLQSTFAPDPSLTGLEKESIEGSFLPGNFDSQHFIQDDILGKKLE